MRAVLAMALGMALAIGAGGCGHSQAGNGTNPQPGTPTPHTTNGKTTTTTTTTTSTQDYGLVDARFVSGDDKVSCDSFNVEVKVTAPDGKARWKANAQRTDTFADRTPALGVQVTPSEGVLEQGKSTVIRVKGSFDKRNQFFYVFFETPNRIGPSGRALGFKCR